MACWECGEAVRECGSAGVRECGSAGVRECGSGIEAGGGVRADAPTRSFLATSPKNPWGR